MPYASQADLTTRYGEKEIALATDRVSGAVIDAAVVTRALADADALIESWLSARYAVPVTPVPALLTDIACQIARYRLNEDAASERVRDDYKGALAQLKALAAGDAVLTGAAPAGSAGAVPGGAPKAERDDPQFGADNLSGY
jgi:phage gp36-like protein